MVNRTSLVWKYFFEQKWEEIYNHFEEWLPGYIGLTIIPSIASQIFWATEETYFIAKIGCYIISFWMVVGFIYILGIIFNWLKDNWELANEKADRDIRNIKKGRKRK